MTFTPVESGKINKELEFMTYELELAESRLLVYKGEASKINLSGGISRIHEDLITTLEREIKILKIQMSRRRNERY